MTNEVFFTVIIPTRERHDTLVHAINTVLCQDYNNFEILVSDNASLDKTRSVVESFKDTRLRYIRTDNRISMSHNWEFAINHVVDGWITILGDDDGMLPGALNSVNSIILNTGTTAIRSNGCSYLWPGINGSLHGRMSTSLRRGYEIRKSCKWLQLVIDGRADYKELPMLYNGGFVSLALVNRAKKQTGNFFLSMTPDVYSAIVFSFLTEEYVYSHEPLSINGASLHSGGTAGFERVKSVRPYDPAEKFFSEDNIPFYFKLPLTRSGRPVRSIPVLIYEAFLQAKSFHKLKKIRTSDFKQIVIAIKQSGPCPQEIREWIEDFALQNQIDLPKNYLASGFFLLRIYIRFANFLSQALSSSSIRGSDRIPLHTVFEASLIAGFIIAYPPSILTRIVLRINHLFQDLKCLRK